MLTSSSCSELFSSLSKLLDFFFFFLSFFFSFLFSLSPFFFFLCLVRSGLGDVSRYTILLSTTSSSTEESRLLLNLAVNVSTWERPQIRQNWNLLRHKPYVINPSRRVAAVAFYFFSRFIKIRTWRADFPPSSSLFRSECLERFRSVWLSGLLNESDLLSLQPLLLCLLLYLEQKVDELHFWIFDGGGVNPLAKRWGLLTSRRFSCAGKSKNSESIIIMGFFRS